MKIYRVGVPTLLLGVVFSLSSCATPAQKLANDKCHGHWQVITSQVNGKTMYSAACAPASKTP